MNTPAGSYQLGIDLGTTYTAAAVAREGRVGVVGLGNRAASIPSVIYLRHDGTVLTGEAASRHGPSEPGRVAREFKRRFGDPTPILLGGTPYSAEALTARMLRWVVEKVTELEGGTPDRIAVTHPANWGPYKKDLLAQALRLADVDAITLTEPEAAAIAYAANERVDPGAVVAVYDLGGGTFDAAVLRKMEDGFTILGQPEGIERLGGIDFDEAVVQHVRSALGGALDQVDPDDEQAMAALARLRAECVEAKEALSSDTETTIPVLLPGVQTEVRLTRAEFEQMIRPTLTETVSALRRALATAAVEPAEVSAVLLVGGSSRIPLVAELVSDALGRPIAVDAHPKHAIALGAARAATPVESPSSRPDPGAVPLAGAVSGQAPLSAAPPEPALAHLAAPPTSPPVVQPSRPARRLLLVGALSAAILAAGAWAVSATVLRGDETPADARTEQDGGGEANSAEDDEAPDDAPDESPDESPDDAPDDAPDDDTAEESSDPQASETEAAAVEVPPGERFVTIDGITVDDGTYVVEYTTHEYEAELPGEHVHFFFDTVPPDEAGVPGSGPWILYGGPSPFTEYTTADRPEGASQMCALVANPDHSVVADSGTCHDLP
ncbi:MAG TPA: Hsp70 family protein [Jiangellaceae bacterium]